MIKSEKYTCGYNRKLNDDVCVLPSKMNKDQRTFELFEINTELEYTYK